MPGCRTRAALCRAQAQQAAVAAAAELKRAKADVSGANQKAAALAERVAQARLCPWGSEDERTRRTLGTHVLTGLLHTASVPAQVWEGRARSRWIGWNGFASGRLA